MPGPPLPLSATRHLRALFRAEQDEALIARAIERGVLRAEDVEAARATAASEGGSVLRALRARGALDAHALDALEAELAAEAFSRPALARQAAPPPDEVRAAAADPGRHLAQFVLVDPIGRGGAGEVWRAWDGRLDRWVAIKLSTAGQASGTARERFEREALAAARLHHPNIVPVYQVGFDRGRGFLVMPLIEGRTLDEVDVPPRRAVELLRTAALAVEHAHAAGLVHRDLKPANLMLARDGTVFVLDFGLVALRREASSRLTRPGDVLGTASYMSPEQARGEGEARGVATDVYGLGATLYHLVTGRPPYEGDSFAAVAAQVLAGALTPPRKRRPDLDPRLETVILKAMAPDPQRRYASAAALADDLQRLLDDRDVVARPEHPLRRALRGARRRPALTVSAGAVLLLAAVLGAARLRLGSERAAAVEAHRALVRLSLETALGLRRGGDVAGLQRLVPRLEASYEGVASRGAVTAEIESLMGRMRRALLDDARALAHQERALALDPDHAPARYERAVLLSRSYGQALDAFVDGLGTPAPAGDRAVLLAEEQRPDLARLRAAILADGTALQRLPLSDLDARAAHGILAYHERRYGEARRVLAAVVEAAPLREEAWETLARAAEGAGDVGAAERAYAQAIALDAGYLPHRQGRCELRRRAGRLREAIEDAEAALRLDPGEPPAAAARAARVCGASARAQLGHGELVAGRDPLPLFSAARADYDAVLAAGEDVAARWGRATLLRYLAVAQDRRGDDPFPALDASEADLTRALDLEPGRPDGWTGRGRTRGRRAALRLARGEDPLPDVAGAEADLTEALRLAPRRPEAYDWRGDARTVRARWRLAQGQPAQADFRAAEEDFAAGIALYASDPWLRLHRGRMRVDHGHALAREGGDPLPVWAAAEEDLSFAAGRLPGAAEPLVGRSALRLARAEHHAARGRRALATSDKKAAAADLAAALVVDPTDAEAARLRPRLDAGR